MNTISFPGLGLHFTINPVAFSLGNLSVKWYGIIIAAGLLLALMYGLRRSKSFGVSSDDLADITIFGIVFGIIGARLYYVLFFIDPTTGTNPYFADPKSIIYIWNGGLGIYGGVIAAFLTAFIICKKKKISVGAVFDIVALGFLIGQSIGRWGNFVNQEAFGSATNLPWRMVVNTASTPVHPCFLYESLWCILGFILLHIYSKHRKFNGEIFLMYISWYAFGRFFIEGLRSDSLMLGNIKISQLVAAIFFCASIAFLIYKRVTVKKALEEQVADYNPLFEDTSKAVEEDTTEQKIDEGEYSDSDTDNTDENESDAGDTETADNTVNGEDGDDTEVSGKDDDKTEDED
jgi:phosphatidylglycerol:prolipoprotein diacylglycerol transferase